MGVEGGLQPLSIREAHVDPDIGTDVQRLVPVDHRLRRLDTLGRVGVDEGRECDPVRPVHDQRSRRRFLVGGQDGLDPAIPEHQRRSCVGRLESDLDTFDRQERRRLSGGLRRHGCGQREEQQSGAR